MKLFVATDVHGSAYWAERIVNKFRQSQADALVLLGDIYNHGPRNPFPQDYAPMRVAEIFNAVADKIVAVKGNCDSEVDQFISQFPFVNDCVIPFKGGKRLYCTHGHVYNKHELPPVAAGDIVIYGHFHFNDHQCVDGVHCIGLSSVALPKDKAAYATADERGVEVFDFDDERLFFVGFDN